MSRNVTIEEALQAAHKEKRPVGRPRKAAAEKTSAAVSL